MLYPHIIQEYVPADPSQIEDELSEGVNAPPTTNYGSSLDLTQVDMVAAMMAQYPVLEDSTQKAVRQSEKTQEEVANAMSTARQAELTLKRKAAVARHKEVLDVPPSVQDGLYRVQTTKFASQLFKVEGGKAVLVVDNPLVELDRRANSLFVEDMEKLDTDEIITGEVEASASQVGSEAPVTSHGGAADGVDTKDDIDTATEDESPAFEP
jgi:hypothetical protein